MEFCHTYHYRLLKKLIHCSTVKRAQVNTVEASLLPEGKRVRKNTGVIYWAIYWLTYLVAHERGALSVTFKQVFFCGFSCMLVGFYRGGDTVPTYQVLILLVSCTIYSLFSAFPSSYLKWNDSSCSYGRNKLNSSWAQQWKACNVGLKVVRAVISIKDGVNEVFLCFTA